MSPSWRSPGVSGPGRCGPRRSRTAFSRRACSGSRPGASAATTAWAIARCCWRSPGSTRAAVAERTRRLAGDDWSSFPPAEQRAYAYARKLTKTPWELTAADYKGLENDLGPEKAMATFWWLCRGLYMTRVSDGFQLPLERDNVFADFFGKGSSRPEASPSLSK